MADVVTILKFLGSKVKDGIDKAIALEHQYSPFVHQVAGEVALVNPAIGGAIEVADTFADQLTSAVGLAEQAAVAFGSKDGATKLTLAAPAVEEFLMDLPIFKGKKITDPTKFNTALAQFSGSWADLLNSVSSSAAEQAAPAPTAWPTPPVQAPAAAIPNALPTSAL